MINRLALNRMVVEIQMEIEINYRRGFAVAPLQGSDWMHGPHPGLTPWAIACRSFGAGSSPKGAAENSQGRKPLDSGLLHEEPCRGGTSRVVCPLPRNNENKGGPGFTGTRPRYSLGRIGETPVWPLAVRTAPSPARHAHSVTVGESDWGLDE